MGRRIELELRHNQGARSHLRTNLWCAILLLLYHLPLHHTDKGKIMMIFSKEPIQTIDITHQTCMRATVTRITLTHRPLEMMTVMMMMMTMMMELYHTCIHCVTAATATATLAHCQTTVVMLMMSGRMMVMMMVG